jgi:hypothetical protein
VKDGGHQFEMKMTAVTGLRGLQKGDNFNIFFNRDDAGNFDDIVYSASGRRGRKISLLTSSCYKSGLYILLISRFKLRTNITILKLN